MTSLKSNSGGTQNDPNLVFSFAQEFAKSMQQTTSTIQELLGELKDHSVAMTSLKEQFSYMKDNVATLNALVKDEGPTGSLITRFAILHREVCELKQWKDDDKKSKEAERTEGTKGKYVVYAAMMTSAVALIGTILHFIIGMNQHQR